MAALVVVTAGCPLLIDVPYPIDAVTTKAENVDIFEDLYVTLGPRSLIQDISKGIVRRNKAVRLVDPLLVRDYAFPDGGWTLEGLLSEAACGRVQQELALDFIVLLLVTAPATAMEEDSVSFGIGRVGYETEHGHLAALIIDTQAASVLCRLDTVASGTAHYFVTWSGGYATHPMTENAVTSTLSKEIAASFAGQPENAQFNVSVLAAEPLYQP